MKKRTGYMIAAAVLVLLCLTGYEVSSLVPKADGWISQTVSKENEMYAASESGDGQRLYKIKEDGTISRISEAVQNVNSAAVALSADQSKVFWLSSYKENDSLFYRFASYDKKLKLLKEVKKQTISGRITEGMYAGEDKVIFTTLSEDQKTAHIYEVDLKKEAAGIKEKEQIQASDNRYFIRAASDGSRFYAQYDNGAVTVTEAGKLQADTAFPDRVQTDIQSDSAKIHGAGAVLKAQGVEAFAGALLKELLLIAAAVLLYAIAGSKSYRWQRFAVQEILLIGVITVFGTVSIRALNAQYKDSYVDETKNHLEMMQAQMEKSLGFMETEGYTETKEYEAAAARMLEAKHAKQWKEEPLSICLVKKENTRCRVVMSDAAAANTQPDTDETTLLALKKAEEKNALSFESGVKNGRRTTVYAMPATGQLQQNSYWLVRMPEQNEGQQAAGVEKIRLFGGLILLAGTMIVWGLLLLEGQQMQLLSDAMRDAACGRYNKKRRLLSGNAEMEQMWNGLEAYAKELDRISYQQSQLQKIYTRYVPGAVKGLFEDKKCENLTPGEYVTKTGVVGCISVEKEPEYDLESRMRMVNRISGILSEIQEEEPAVFIPQTADLEEIWGIFLEDIAAAIQTGIHLEGRLQEKNVDSNVMMLLHKTGFTYGITGDEGQVLPYFSVEKGRELLYYAQRLREFEVRIAVTEQVESVLRSPMSLRCIGFIELSGIHRNLYEVLDAYPAEKKQSLEKQNGKFDKALELYYGSDFYLARNIFADILRECPQDHIAKWYLFACESRLGDVKSVERGYGLFSEM